MISHLILIFTAARVLRRKGVVANVKVKPNYQLKYAKKKFTRPSCGSYIKISGNFCRQIVAIFSSLPKIGWVEQMYMMSEVIPLMIVAQQNENKRKNKNGKYFHSFITMRVV